MDEFVARLRVLAAKCKFADVGETHVRLIEQIIVGTKHVAVQEKLLEKGDSLSSLDAALDIARTYEATKSHVAQLQSTSSSTVHGVQKQQSSASASTNCTRCGLDHSTTATCPAKGATCLNCGKPNHWAQVCKAKRGARGRAPAKSQRARQRESSKPRAKPRQRSHQSRVDELTDDLECLVFQSVDEHGETTDDRSQAFVTLQLDIIRRHRSTALKAKIDTGAQANVLPLRVYRRMFPDQLTAEGLPRKDQLKPSTTKLVSYGGTQLRQYGVCTLKCTFDDMTLSTDFFVTDADGPTIIGLPSLEKFGIITVNCEIATEASEPPPDSSLPKINGTADLLRLYPECFRGVGKFEGTYHITTDPDVPPVIHAPRRVPISMKADIKAELDAMEEQGIITRVREGEPTRWVNSLVYRRKPNGQIRICLDPKDLNKAILRDHHTTPTLDEILPTFKDAKFFSIVDAKSGYWNVELDEPSSYLTTFNSPFGRYRFRRMPFGLKMSQDVFQSKIDQLLEGCNGTTGIADDMVVYGRTEEEHDRNLHGLMQRCAEKGLNLNPEKSRIKESEIKFFGVICSNGGVGPNPTKVAALQKMAPPTNHQQLQSFLGLATYMSTFIPNLSTRTAPLRELTTRNTIFRWTREHQQAFDDIRSAISEETTLTYFDPTKPITLQVDASQSGIGAALLQGGKPVSFASKSLTDTESRYANIEREMLAVVYGCERFHTFLFGQQFVVESDHKPLSSIYLKHLHNAPPRLRRMLLRLQPYSLTIEYKPGKDVAIADALSRLSADESHGIPDMEVQIHDLKSQFGAGLLDRLRHETSQDNELNMLREVIYQGWPEERSQVPTATAAYWNYRDELAIEDGLLIKGERIIIPHALRIEILNQLHAAHQGAENMKLRARSAVFWPGMNKDIDTLASQCPQCQETQPKQKREPLTPSDVPPCAWHTVGVDLFSLNSADYIVIADYYSKYPFSYKLHSTESNAVIRILKTLFAEQGSPAVVRSDNGPQFTSHQFKQFAHEYDFKHVTSSPHHPQSNGFIESQVKIVKHALAKAAKSGLDAGLALLCVRSTPVDNKSKSPAELLFGRQLQDNLPRRFVRKADESDYFEHLRERQQRQKSYFDVGTKSLPPVVPGQEVMVRHPVKSTWEPATVKSVSHPHSAVVETSSGSAVRRNTVDLRPRPPKQVRFKPSDSVPDAMPAAAADSDADTSGPSESPNTSPSPPEEVYTTKSGREVHRPKRLDL